MELFEGHKEAYGKYNTSGENREDGKVKGFGVTVREKVTATLWDLHVFGKQQLGIIPINQDNLCKFGAIDIDDYKLDAKAINSLIKKYGLPLIQFRSKSGGSHLFIFVEELISAKLMQQKLKEFAAIIGRGEAEIFPKQTKLLKDRGDIGQWINMPYFKGNDTERYAYNLEDNSKLTLIEFLQYVETKIVSVEHLKEIEFKATEDLPDGPPCLQFLVKEGFPEGVRNKGLFNMAVYAKKVDPDNWRPQVEEYNNKFMKPPLSPKEVLVVIDSVNRKEYSYSCTKEPICSHCNKQVCRGRKYGIGLEGIGMPKLGSLSKLDCDPPIWFLDTEDGGRITCSTDELSSPSSFQKVCMAQLSTMPPIFKRETWHTIVSVLFENITVIPVPKEATASGRLLIHLSDFLALRPNSEDDTEILRRGGVYVNEGYVHFRLQDFVEYLERKKFNLFGAHEIHSIFKDNEVLNKTLKDGAKSISVYCVPSKNEEPKKVKLPKPGSNIPF